MKHIERFLATVERRPVDHPASWLGLPTGEAMPGLLSYFGADDIAGVKKIIDEHLADRGALPLSARQSYCLRF